MASNIDKKKHIENAENSERSKGLNTFLWLLSILIIAIAAVGNIYFAQKFSTPIRVVAVVILMLVAFAILAITSQGKKAREFLSASRTELRKIVWPTRAETTQTTLIVVGVTVFISLILWGVDSIIVTVINFLTDLRF
ncbi:preprotein translocase subunit SecE [Avibacterium sp. 21-586]|uniref:preprotein translocase subunit SecE n=1 Tax=Avibacterium sp. 21-586 TaxID=2911534 RepID=UPI002247F2AB|nr:preprotein translocase subunit SecE [Avibacterium sp. 21-586]MCW9711271.1 preprotein translocase subunit SecE [Avibacterium sp. 21-586]